MAPIRDIRSFFKPAPAPATQQPAERSARPAHSASSQRGSSAHRVWPAPRTETPRPLPPTIPVKRPSADLDGRPPAASASTRPSGSQSSVNSGGTKKVTVNGEQMVLDSNSDSDSDVLVELDFGPISSSRKKIQLSPGAEENTRENMTQSNLSGHDSELRKPSNNKTSAKISLKGLVQSAQRDAEAERDILAGKADLDQPLEEEGPLPEADIDEDALAGVLDDDEGVGKAKRLYLAMQRTNAFQTNCVYHFFSNRSNISSPRRSPFPIQAFPEHRWVSIFQDDSRRDQAFLARFAEQIFEYQELPPELALWMVDELCLGSNEALEIQYLHLLKAHPKHLRDILSRDRMNNIFASLGADVQSLNSSKPVVPSGSAAEDSQAGSKNSVPPPLQNIMRLIKIAAPHLHPEASSYLLAALVHICLDDDVGSNAAILHEAQDTTESILSNIPNLSLTPMFAKVVPLLTTRITHPVLQNTLIQSLPSMSPFSATFRRHLALAFLLHPTPLNIPLSSSDLPDVIHDHLNRSPDFFITKTTNYASLAAHFSLLDIGIGPGPMKVPYPRPPELSFDDSQHAVLPQRIPLSTEDHTFNKEVDALAKHIKLLSNNIVEAGAISDLSRLDAKDSSERMVRRLENAVRIGGGRRKNIFDDEDEMKEGSSRVFRKWFIKSEGNSDAPGVKMEDVKSRLGDIDGAGDVKGERSLEEE